MAAGLTRKLELDRGNPDWAKLSMTAILLRIIGIA
jgi:hypothetical protein